MMNHSERSIELVSAFRQKWFWMWVLLPIVAYYVSWLLVMLPYPVFLVIAQWRSLNHLNKKGKTGLWACNIGMLGLTWVVMFIIYNFFPMEDEHRVSIFSRVGFLTFFGVYYGLQMINELLFSAIFTKWRFGYWSVSNLMAVLVWVGASFIVGNLFNHVSRFELFVGLYIPIIGVFSNIITGLGIHLATQSCYEV
jgi:hypothetical protein